MGEPTLHVCEILEPNCSNVKAAFKTMHNIQFNLVRNKDSMDKLYKRGVSELRCNDCPTSHVGKIYRNFGKRIKEHCMHIEL